MNQGAVYQSPSLAGRLLINRRLINALFCAAFYLYYESFYAAVAVLNDGNMRAIYDPELMGMWRGWLVIAAALPALCTPNAYRASHVLNAIMYFMVYIPILVVVPNHLPTVTAIYAIVQVAVGMALVLLIAAQEPRLRNSGNGLIFWVALSLVSAATLLPIAIHAAKYGVQITGIEDNELLREDLNMSTLTLYAVNFWVSAIGPLWLAIFLFRRRYILFAITSLSFALVYGISFQKFMLFTPFWVFGFYLICVVSRSGGLMSMLTGAAIPAAIALASQFTSFAYYGSGYIGYRMYGIHGMIFVHYVDFFEKNPETWFSHIKGINWFFRYPFHDVLPLMIGASYPGGNQNAHFWAMDAVAGGGLNAIIWVSILFGLLMMVLNLAAKGLPAALVLPCLSVVALRFADGPIATNLLTGGFGLLIVLLFLMPRGSVNFLEKRQTAMQPAETDEHSLKKAAIL